MTLLLNSPRDLKILDVVAFVTTAETGSITQAALARGCSHSILSRRVRELEASVGGSLFSRTGRGVQLTELGIVLLPQAKILLANVDQLLEQATSSIERPSGTVRVALPRWAVDGPVAKLANRVSETFPKIRLVILEAYSDEITDKLASNKIDIGVFTSRSQEPAPNARLLFHSDLFLLGRLGAQLVAKETVPFAALHGVRLIMPPTPNYLEGMLQESASASGITLRVDLETDSSSIIREIVRQSNRYGITVMQSIKSDLLLGGLGVARIVEPKLQLYTFCSTGPKHQITHASRAVEECVISVMMDHHHEILDLVTSSGMVEATRGS